jgi:hypothetical protein
MAAILVLGMFSQLRDHEKLIRAAIARLRDVMIKAGGKQVAVVLRQHALRVKSTKA